MRLGIEGRTAVVLGGTSGLGRAAAAALVEEGARVLVAGRDPDKTARAAQEVAAVPLVVDLTSPEAADLVVGAAADLGAGVDILVLNGGGPPPGSAASLTGADVDEATALLVRTHVELVSRLLPGMRERGWGRIVAVGSSGVQQPIDNLARSNLGRAALAGYLKTLAAEVAADGVTVNMVLPGRIATDRLRSLDQGRAERTGLAVEEVSRASQATIPAGRYGRPEEFGAVVAFVASDRASYLTGEEIRVDGGLVRAAR